ncbi:DUF4846 domain-containing protein [Chitinophagaceae bacterium MMS25-I14]
MMFARSSVFFCVLLCCGCADSSSSQRVAAVHQAADAATGIPAVIKDIPLPEGYTRIPAQAGSFAAWLRNVPLKKNKTVYLYNGQPKANQKAQYAVLDISTGNKDLQQCADAVMRLRAEYLYAQKRFNEISFTDNAGKVHSFAGRSPDRASFDKYLEEVFAWCGTASLSKQLHATPIGEIQPGDVLIKGGSPGHAVIVMDVAQNKRGRKLYLIAQSYMPAQDIHVLINPAEVQLSPWYDAGQTAAEIVTPEWIFYRDQLKRW